MSSSLVLLDFSALATKLIRAPLHHRTPYTPTLEPYILFQLLPHNRIRRTREVCPLDVLIIVQGWAEQFYSAVKDFLVCYQCGRLCSGVGEVLFERFRRLIDGV